MTDPALPSVAAVDAYFPQHLKPAPLPYPNQTKSFWLNSSNDCNPLANAGRDSQLRSEVDILIIGSGHSGICTLYHLVQQLKTRCRHVKRIAVLEARQFSSGATGNNGGHCTAFLPGAFGTLVKKEGLEDAVRHVELEQRSVNFVLKVIKDNHWEDDVDLVEGGAIHLIRSKEEHSLLVREVEAARKAGIDVSQYEFMDAKACSELTFSREGLTGLRYPGNNLYPVRFINRLYGLAHKEAQVAGISVDLYTHCAVEHIDASMNGEWTAVTARGSMKARQVVHATNAWASHLLPQLATGHQRLVPCRGQVVAVRPQQLEKRWNAGFMYNEGFEYFFQRPSGRRSQDQQHPYIILGGGRSVAPKPYELDIADDTTVQTPEVETYLKQFLPLHFPTLFDSNTDLAIDYHWTGLMCFTESRNPFVGAVYANGQQQKGQYMLAGFSGHGMSRCPASAEAIALMLVAELEGKQNTVSWLPTHFLTTPH